MTLRNATIPNDDRLRVLEALIQIHARGYQRGDPTTSERYNVLKSLRAEIVQRAGVTPSKALAEIERKLELVKQIKGVHTNDPAKLASLGITIVQYWPLIRAALESNRENADDRVLPTSVA